MSSNLKIVGLFVCLQIAFSMSMMILRDECPDVEVDPNANATDCSPCPPDCSFKFGYLCCPNSCGTFSCDYFRNPCVVDDRRYNHHDWIPLPNNYETDKCGDCWCQNGQKKCYTYSCTKGGRP